MDSLGNPMLKYVCWVMVGSVTLCLILVLFTSVFDKRPQAQPRKEEVVVTAGSRVPYSDVTTPPLEPKYVADLTQALAERTTPVTEGLSSLRLYYSTRCMPCSVFLPVITQFVNSTITPYPSLTMYDCSPSDSRPTQCANVAGWPSLIFYTDDSDLLGSRYPGKFSVEDLSDWLTDKMNDNSLNLLLTKH